MPLHAATACHQTLLVPCHVMLKAIYYDGELPGFNDLPPEPTQATPSILFLFVPATLASWHDSHKPGYACQEWRILLASRARFTAEGMVK